jgi:tetratricopeptide (TPR) repeat protein
MEPEQQDLGAESTDETRRFGADETKTSDANETKKLDADETKNFGAQSEVDESENLGSESAAGETSGTNAEREIVLTHAKDWDDVLGLDDDDPHGKPKPPRHYVAQPGMKLDFIDDRMVEELAEYGRKYRALTRNLHIAAFVFGALVLGFIPGIFSFNIWPWFFITAGIATIYASMLAMRVAEAYSKHQYRAVSKLMNKALWWNQFCSPLSLISYLALSRIQARMLLLQGRYMEMEALLIISRAASEKKPDWGQVPKSAYIANDLACTYLAQHRYDEAESLLKNLVHGTKRGPIVPFAVVNLALCYVKMDQPAEATKLLDRFDSVMKKAEKLLKIRVDLIRAMIDVKEKKYEGVDDKLEELIPTARRMSESNEFIAACYLSLADVREQQKRFDEAELHYRTAIDLFKANDNPSYWSLAEALRAYAKMLAAEGRTTESEKQIDLAAHYEHAYLEREITRMGYLRYRITHEKPVQLLTDLINVDGFPALAIETSPPGLHNDDGEELTEPSVHQG